MEYWSFGVMGDRRIKQCKSCFKDSRAIIVSSVQIVWALYTRSNDVDHPEKSYAP